jgi:hypothetical protein
MTFNDNLAAHYANVEQSNIMNSFVKYYIDSELVALKALITGAAPETLDTLQELAAALSDDPQFFANIAASVAAVQADVDQNEADADSAIAAETAARGVAVNAETVDREAAVAALQALIDAIQTEAAARNARITALEADPTTATAVAAVQSDVDQNEADADAADAALSARLDVLETDPTTASALAVVQADVDQNEADADAAIAVERNRIDAILAGADADKDTFAEIVTLINSVDTTNDNAFAAYVLSNDAAVAAVQADVDQNETDGDAADAALSGRLDVLEADPTTAAAVAAVQSDVDQNEADSDAAEAALSGRLDTLEADPTTQTAVDAKLNIASPAATGTLTVDTNASLKFDSNLTKVENVLRGTGINIGNNIEMIPAAAGGRVEITGDLIIDASDFVDASNDGEAATAGVVVGQVYRNGSDLKVRIA